MSLGYTLAQLRAIATKCQLPGRSKFNKQELYDRLVGSGCLNPASPPLPLPLPPLPTPTPSVLPSLPLPTPLPLPSVLPTPPLPTVLPTPPLPTPTPTPLPTPTPSVLPTPLPTPSVLPTAEEQIHNWLRTEVDPVEPSYRCTGLLRLQDWFLLMADTFPEPPCVTPRLVLKLHSDRVEPVITDELQGTFLSCIANIVIIPLTVVDAAPRSTPHSNVIIINQRRRTYEYFEPHGHNTSGWGLQVQEYMATQFPLLLGLSNYTFVNPYGVTCPRIGPQSITEDVFDQQCSQGGLCLAWTSLYAHLRLQFPDIPETTILQELLRYSDLDLLNLIRRYLGYQERELGARLRHFVDRVEVIGVIGGKVNRKNTRVLTEIVTPDFVTRYVGHKESNPNLQRWYLQLPLFSVPPSVWAALKPHITQWRWLRTSWDQFYGAFVSAMKQNFVISDDELEVWLLTTPASTPIPTLYAQLRSRDNHGLEFLNTWFPLLPKESELTLYTALQQLHAHPPYPLITKDLIR